MKKKIIMIKIQIYDDGNKQTKKIMLKFMTFNLNINAIRSIEVYRKGQTSNKYLQKYIYRKSDNNGLDVKCNLQRESQLI